MMKCSEPEKTENYFFVHDRATFAHNFFLKFSKNIVFFNFLISMIFCEKVEYFCQKLKFLHFCGENPTEHFLDLVKSGFSGDPSPCLTLGVEPSVSICFAMF